MDEQLPDGTKLPPDWALEYPGDWIEVLKQTTPLVIKDGGVKPQDVIGVGIDFTACTMLLVDKVGVPLCMKPEWEHNINSYIKHWEHNATQVKANALNAKAEEMGEDFLKHYGGKISSEWMFLKIWQTLNEAPEVYEAGDRFLEAGYWVVMQLTDNEYRNSCMAGYKATWSNSDIRRRNSSRRST